MNIYDFEFIGRERGAIGITYKINASRMAEDEDAARLALYDDFDHILVRSVAVRQLEHEIGHTLRSSDGQRRVTYRPDWSLSQPWASYNKGTAGRHFTTENQAKNWLTSKD